jgi:hypothetical protein
MREVAIALAFLAPALVAFALLGLGRFPGEQLLQRGRAPRRRRARPSQWGSRVRWAASVPRGGELLAASLAGRAPPWSGVLI